MIRNTKTRRAGYTLIELLVVIAIIAVLVSLTAGAVMKVRTVMPRTQSLYEVGKMQEGLQVAQQTYGNTGQPLPSMLKLWTSIAQYRNPPDTLTQQTGVVLQSMFGRRFIQYGTTVNWDGAGTSPIILEGDQVLVFYLGGIPNTTATGNQCLGFSNSATDPTAAGGTRIGPFYQFASNRLVNLAHAGTANNNSAKFFSYLDPYGTKQPFVFFGAAAPNSYSLVDCPSQGIQPYFQTVNGITQFFNPNTFQIISAGADGKFGAGGSLWSPTAGAGDAPTRDNQTNFTKSLLQAPQS